MAKHASKFAKVDSIPITFTKENARRIMHPHNDPLVVVLKIAKERVLKVLINMGVQ